ncbi:MAG: sterol desaturase family protein [Rhodanobacteraceae bacterium]
MHELSQIWMHMADWVAAHAVVPMLTRLHLTGVSGDPHDIAEAWMIAIIQVGIIALIFRPLESLMPAQRWSDRRLTRVDRRYTLIMLMGLNPLFAYLVLMPLSHWLGVAGGSGANPEDSLFSLTHWLPALRQHPFVLFATYYVVFDFTYYWMHRTQHAIPWWWALHSMHHSQRQMSCWTNDRGSYLDGFLQSMVLATVGIVMGVAPDQFALLNLISELVQNFSHANVRIGFGRRLERLLVDPKFHRLHHMRVDVARPGLHNCNYGQVLSVWDVLFGTALYGEAARPTGVGDPSVDADNDYGVVMMQWRTLLRFWGAVRRPAGWKLGEVTFGADYAPIPVNHATAFMMERQATGGHVNAAVPP